MIADEDDVHDILCVSDELRQELMNRYIEPYYKKMVADTLSARSFYKNVGMVFETTSKMCIAVSQFDFLF